MLTLNLVASSALLLMNIAQIIMKKFVRPSPRTRCPTPDVLLPRPLLSSPRDGCYARDRSWQLTHVFPTFPPPVFFLAQVLVVSSNDLVHQQPHAGAHFTLPHQPSILGALKPCKLRCATLLSGFHSKLSSAREHTREHWRASSTR